MTHYDGDIDLVCTDCGAPFVHGPRDQRFFASKGWNPPKRCKACARAKREAFNEPTSDYWKANPE